MKKRTAALTLVLLMTLFSNLAVNAQTGAGSPGAVIRNFYKWYIEAVDAGPDPFKQGKVTLKKYVTSRLIAQIARMEAKGLDADYFMQTQEWDGAWANNIDVPKLTVAGSTGSAIVTFGSDNYPRVVVTLVKAAGIWKIDRVKDASK